MQPLNPKLEIAWLQIIRSDYPNVAKSEITRFVDGWDHIVYVVRKKQAYRFVRRVEETDRLIKEAVFCKIFRKLSPVNIPNYSIHKNKKYNLKYVTYPFIIGDQLSISKYHCLSKKQKIYVTRTLALFLKTIHKFPLKKAEELNVRKADLSSKHWHAWFTKTIPIVKHCISKETIAQIEAFQQRFLDTIDRSNIIPCVIHSDMGHEHIILSKKPKLDIGIIDFTDVKIGDPAYDFALLSDYGKPFMDRLYKKYDLPIDRLFKIRETIYRSRVYLNNLRFSVLTRSDQLKLHRDQLTKHFQTLSL